MRRSLALALAVAVSLAVGVATPGAARAASDAAGSATAGPAPRSLRILSVLDDEVTDWIVADFTRRTGIEVSRPLGRRSSLEGFTDLRERHAPLEVSVVLGGPGVVWARAARDGPLEPYASPELAGFEAPADPANRWFCFYRGTIAFVTAREPGSAPPGKWSDLLRSDGPAPRIALANPATSGTAFTVVSGLAAFMGEDAAFRFLDDLEPRMVGHPSAGSAVVSLVREGVANVGLAFDHDIEREILAGAPLTISYPSEGAPTEIGGVGILRDAPERESARAFVDHLLSREFQERLAREDVALFEPLRGGIPAPRWRADMPQPNRVVLEPGRVAAAQERLLDRWNEVVMARDGGARASLGSHAAPAPSASPRDAAAASPRSRWVDVLAVVLALGIYALLRRRTSILPRFLVLVLLSVLVTALGIDRFSVRLEREATLERRRLQARTATELLAEESALDLVARNGTALRSRVDKLFRYFPGELVEVAILNPSGEQVLHARWVDRGGEGRVDFLPPAARGLGAAGVAGRAVGSSAAVTTVESVLDPASGHVRLVVRAPMVGYEALRGEVRASFEPAAVEPSAVTSGWNVLWVALAATLIGALALSLFVGREIVAPLDRLRERMTRVGRGELAADPHPGDLARADEVALLATSFQEMLVGLRQMIGETQAVSAELEYTLGELSTHASALDAPGVREPGADPAATRLAERAAALESLRGGATEIRRHLNEAQAFVEESERALPFAAEAARQAEAGAESTALATGDLASAAARVEREIDAMRTHLHDASALVGAVVNAASDTGDQAHRLSGARGGAQAGVERGRMLLHGALDGLAAAAGTISEFVTLGRELDANAEQVGYLVKLISEVSEEAGVLALNAAILAAQAGDEGVGFSVVAEEMRGLASRVEQEAREADALVRSIALKVERAVTAAADGQRSVGQAMGAANQMDVALEGIEGGLARAMDLVDSVAAASADQDRRGRQLLESVQELEDRVEATAAEGRRQAELGERIRADVARLAAAARELTAVADRQSERLAQTRAALDAGASQTSICDTALESEIAATARLVAHAALAAERAVHEREHAHAIVVGGERLRGGLARLRAFLHRFNVDG
ncbi:MAG: ABC transporter substrate-binding protein [Deltaproteobacteria bacterium]|nr:ABC transporter substrate-binding protein [Deltaproteobacteria bacterium]